MTMLVIGVSFHASSSRFVRWQEPHATCFDLVDRTDNLHSPFRHARFPFRRIQDLANRPTHVAFDGARRLFFGRQRRIEFRKAREDVREKYLNPGTILRPLVLGR